MSAITKTVPMTNVSCDNCRQTVAALGHAVIARQTLTRLHMWKCDPKGKADWCPACAQPELKLDKPA